ncbi:MFS transporter [Paraburkholderia silviterrae]|uniref:MFS transporter n=2 Tax=Paraburkholderia silviterrae TaxID=2528715 RepID=A0A4R5M5T9_9BURK|nr:MFS transporter [Paraburkholderia silviterrae]
MRAPCDVAEFINDRPISTFQLRIVALCFLVVAMDGFDAASIGFIAPAIRSEWLLTPTALASLFGAGLAGLMVGALTFGPLADRVGRRTVLTGSVASFGLACFVSAFAPSLPVLVALRFVTGLGLGGAMPNAITLTAEYCPQRRRSTLLTLMFCGFSLGGALGGVISAALIHDYGWRSVLAAGGAVPLLSVPVLLMLLPESARYLVLSGASAQRVARALARLGPAIAFDETQTFTVRDTRPRGGWLPVLDLFREGNARNTLLLWLTFFMGLMIIYLLSSWLPTVLHSMGFSLRAAALVAALLQTGGVVGAIVLGVLMDRLDPCRVLAFTYCIGCASIFTIGHTATPALLCLAVFVTGCCISGSQTCISILSASFYPTHCRATGVSWASGVGRLGSIAGSVAGGVMLSGGWSNSTIFSLIAAPALAAALLMHRLARSRRGAASACVAATPKSAASCRCSRNDKR